MVGNSQHSKGKWDLFLKFLMVIATLCVSFIVAQPMFAHADTTDTSGSITVHKLKLDPNDPTHITNDGTEQNTGKPGLPGVEFSLYKVSIDDLTNAGAKYDSRTHTFDTSNLDIKKITSSPTKETTDANGLATFKDLDGNPDDHSLYVLFETKTPTGVTAPAQPMVIAMPMRTPDGTGYNKNVHVYPKNSFVLANAVLNKHAIDASGKDNGNLAGAVFNLFKDDGTQIGGDLTTDSRGQINVSDLEVGTYYFKEKSAPNGFELNPHKYYFEVTKDSNGKTITTLHQDAIDGPSLDMVPNEATPNIDKTVNKPDLDYGEVSTWTISTVIPSDANTEHYDSFNITDPLDSRLSYHGDLNIMLNGQKLVNGTDYTVDQEPDFGGQGGTLKINFLVKGDFSKTLKENAGKKVEISFGTTIVPGTDPDVSIPNHAILNVNNHDHDSKHPTVATHGAKFIKYGKDGILGTDKNPLKGAEFVITNSDGKYYSVDKNGNTIWIGDKSQAKVLTSDENGKFEVKGLATGDYNLIETKAPDGYGLLTQPQKFTVDKDSYSNENKIVQVIDSSLPSLPITGGIGTIIFLVIGCLIMGIAYVFYRKNKKLN